MSNYSIAMSPSRSTSNLVGILLGILVFIRTMPCYLWSIEDIIRPVCAVIILIICITNISKKKGTGWIFLCFACAYIWATVFVDHSGIVTIFNFLAFAFIPILKKSTIDDAYSVFRRIFIFFIFLSLLNYALYLIGVDTSILTINPLNSLKDYKYVMHPFLVTVYCCILYCFHSDLLACNLHKYKIIHFYSQYYFSVYIQLPFYTILLHIHHHRIGE